MGSKLGSTNKVGQLDGPVDGVSDRNTLGARNDGRKDWVVVGLRLGIWLGFVLGTEVKTADPSGEEDPAIRKLSTPTLSVEPPFFSCHFIVRIIDPLLAKKEAGTFANIQ